MLYFYEMSLGVGIMISFNVPPFVGKEIEYMKKAVACNLRRAAATGAFASGHSAEHNGHLY